jgi:anti-sigma regulatory factor (Ser/Thr protein kinase)
MCCERLLAHQRIVGVSADSPSRHVDVAPRPSAVRDARRFVADSVAGDARDVATLLASELVTNGILHARTPLTVGVTNGDRRVLVTVADGDPSHPIVRPPDDGRPSGRGLVLVDALAAQWGVDASGTGKTVWFTVDQHDAFDVGTATGVTAQGGAA